MQLTELKPKTVICIHSTDKVHSIEFEASVKEVKGNTIVIDALREDGLVLNFESDRVKNSVSTVIDGRTVIFRDVDITIDRERDRVNHLLFSRSDGLWGNRRSELRHLINLPCTFSLGSHKKAVSATVRDISFRGFNVLSPDKTNLGDTVRVAFVVPIDLGIATSMITLEGRVVYVQYDAKSEIYSYGCQAFKENELLNKYIMYLQRKQLGKIKRATR